MPGLIENFDNVTLEDFYSYPSEDIDTNSFEIVNNTLHVYGNTWKIQYLNNPITLSPDSVWSIKAFINSIPETQNISEIQGFGIATVQPNGSLGDRIKYSFAGEQEVDSDTWEWTYQGAFSIQEWNTYELEVGKDFYRKHRYYPTIEAIYYFNDDDYDGVGDNLASIYFDDLYDITDTNTPPPSVGRIVYTQIDSPENTIAYNFSAAVTVGDGITYYWDFGDGTTSDEVSPNHIYSQLRTQYKVVLKVKDANNKWGWVSQKIMRIPRGGDKFKMVFTGDIMMSRRFECYDYPECNQPGLLNLYGANYLYESVMPLLSEAELKIFNLETVISDADEESAHPTKPLIIKADPSTVEGLVYAGVNKVSLANNHSIDYMEEGIIDTRNILESNNIKFSGAGLNSYEAYLPENISYNGTNIAFIATSDRHAQYNNTQPFLKAGYNKIGFADADMHNINLVINSLYRFSDLNVIELHAGSEYSSTPPGSRISGEYENYNPFLTTPRDADIDFRHELAENQNVDLIVAHHPHVLQGVEWWNNTLIVHSLGNFIFDSDLPETFSSVLFYTSIKNDKFIEYEFKPIFIDHYLTKPAVGELGVHILDYISNLSKDFDTTLSVDKYTNSAKLIENTARIHKTNYLCQRNLTNGRLVYDVDNGTVMWQYDLIRIPNIGNISSIPPLQLASSAKFRVGREKVWFGNMEDEGANLWFLNSNDEYYTTEESFRGTRSIRHNRTSSNTSSILTTIEKRFPLSADIYNLKFSIHAAIKTLNSPQANVEMRYYPSRTGDVIGTQTLSVFPSGTMDWQVYDEELIIPDGTQYFNIWIKSWPPETGSSNVYWDDVGLVQWAPWTEFGNDIDRQIKIKNPNDYYYLQIRTLENMTGQQIAFNETFYGRRNVSNIGDGCVDLSTLLN